jgi:hypothetical protein
LNLKSNDSLERALQVSGNEMKDMLLDLVESINPEHHFYGLNEVYKKILPIYLMQDYLKIKTAYRNVNAKNLIEIELISQNDLLLDPLVDGMQSQNKSYQEFRYY